MSDRVPRLCEPCSVEQVMGRAPTIIKAGTLSKAEQANIQPVEMVDLIMEAKGILARARQDAQRLRDQARTEAEALREKAREEGYAIGNEEGLKAGRETGYQEALRTATEAFEHKHRNLVASCRNLIDDIDACRASWQAAARHDLIDLAMAIANHVAHVVGEREREVVLANLQKAVELAGRRSRVTLVIHPDDADTARQFAPTLLESKQKPAHVDIREDDSIAPGGCRLEWGTGAVDATLETQMNRIASELRHERSRDMTGRDAEADPADEDHAAAQADDKTDPDA